MIQINLENLFRGTAKISEIDTYVEEVLKQNVDGQVVILTGQAPIWLYLIIAHALHGKAKRLIYESPVTGQIVIFNHDPF